LLLLSLPPWVYIPPGFLVPFLATPSKPNFRVVVLQSRYITFGVTLSRKKLKKFHSSEKNFVAHIFLNVTIMLQSKSKYTKNKIEFLLFFLQIKNLFTSQPNINVVLNR